MSRPAADAGPQRPAQARFHDGNVHSLTLKGKHGKACLKFKIRQLVTAGRIEKDLEFLLSSGPDFVTIDCRGGGTGAAPTVVKDNVCLPAIYALRRARRFLDEKGSPVTLCVTGGFRDSSDIAKALALGADAVALATASMIAIGCQQYRICVLMLILCMLQDFRIRFPGLYPKQTCL